MLGNIAAVATAVGLFLAVIGLRQTQRQRVRQFEDFYVSRYWTLMDRLSLEIAVGASNHLLPEDRKAVHAYLVLCEDELDLRAEGWISDATWELWSKGIQDQLGRGSVLEVWEQAKDARRRTRGCGSVGSQIRRRRL